MKLHSLLAGTLIPLLAWPLAANCEVSAIAQSTADYAVGKYEAEMTETLAHLVSFETVAREGVPLEKNGHFTGFKQALEEKAQELGLEYQDHGYVVVVALGTAEQKVGIVTHGDVQPADPAKWAKSPFVLDRDSEPGKLVGRGTEDDKGPIATALYAMKAIRDKEVPLKRRIELLVYLAEESDWDPLKAFLQDYAVPEYNIAIDASYPVVTAEKGWSEIQVTAASAPLQHKDRLYLGEFYGGYFRSQVPDEAHATVFNATPKLVREIRQRAARHTQVQFAFDEKGSTLEITVRGVAVHSSTPEHGVNAIAYLADALRVYDWPANAAGATVHYLNDLVGTGITAEQFGEIAYSDDFMGPMTAAVTMVKADEQGLTSYLNLRRPTGKSAAQLEQEIRAALERWQQSRSVELADVAIRLGEPYRAKGAVHVEPLLQVFRHYTGIEDAGPVAIGGSTNAKLLPSAVSFGPSMPGRKYTGHSEHEFLTEEQFRLNLKMYTAMMVEVANL